MNAQQIQQILDSDPRVAAVVEYPDGFVPNSYRWPAPGTRYVHRRDGTTTAQSYDRKRSHGRGPTWVALSERGGRLASG